MVDLFPNHFIRQMPCVLSLEIGADSEHFFFVWINRNHFGFWTFSGGVKPFCCRDLKFENLSRDKYSEIEREQQKQKQKQKQKRWCSIESMEMVPPALHLTDLQKFVQVLFPSLPASWSILLSSFTNTLFFSPVSSIPLILKSQILSKSGTLCLDFQLIQWFSVFSALHHALIFNWFTAFLCFLTSSPFFNSFIARLME